MNLNTFLNPIKEENIKYIASNRFVEDGKPVEWELKALGSAEAEQLKRKCMVKVAVTGKRGQFTQDFDGLKYMGLLASACTVYPNLNSAELQNGYGVMSPDDLLKKMLNVGEYDAYLKKAQEISGFSESMDELVDEAKN
jgi:Phage XkdN-like protein.